MFERGPNGYWFEDVIWDDVCWIILGSAMIVYGFHLMFVCLDKFDYLAPLIGLSLLVAGVPMVTVTTMYLLGLPV